MIKKKTVPVIFFASGVLLILVGGLGRGCDHLAPGGGQEIGYARAGDDAAGGPAGSARGELAAWLVREGRARLRSGRVGAAEDAAKLAGFLGAQADADGLLAKARRLRAEWVADLDREAKDAEISADAERARRAREMNRRIDDGDGG